MLYLTDVLNLEVACNLQKKFLGGLLMKELVNYAFITDKEVIIALTNGEVYTERIADYDEFGILTQNRRFIQWCGISSINLA